MSVGLSVTQSDVNNVSGSLVKGLFNSMKAVQQFKAWLDTKTDGDLTALGFAQADVNTLRSAFVDLAALASVFEGTGTRTPAYDHRTFSKLLIGTGTY
jgi:hypothetical protein